MTRETKIGLVVGLGFIVVFGILLSHKGVAEPMGPSLEQWAEAPTPAPSLVETPDVPAGTAFADRNPTPGRIDNVPGLQAPDDEGESEIERPLVGPSAEPTEDAEPGSTPPAGPPAGAAPSSAPAEDGTPGEPKENPNPPASTPLPPGPQPGPVRPAILAEHIVQSGDTLYGISRRYYHNISQPAQRAIFRANVSQLRRPEDLTIGQVLRIPHWLPAEHFTAVADPRGANHPAPTRTPASLTSATLAASDSYSVLKNETLYSITRKLVGNGTLWRKLHAVNRSVVPDPRRLSPGTKLRLPRDWAMAEAIR